MKKIDIFLEQLKARDLLPKNIEISTWRNWTLVSAYNSQSSRFISESVSMGVDNNSEVALWKALTEFCERKLSKTTLDPEAYVTARSDGFAAYPIDHSSPQISLNKVKSNALCEAAERYLWSEWWDDAEIIYEIDGRFSNVFQANLDRLSNDFELKGIQRILVEDQEKKFQLSILLGEYARGGFITGGACSSGGDPEESLNRAFGELLRHLVAAKNIKQCSSEYTNSFYELRLKNFASGINDEMVRSRIKTKGKTSVLLPQLKIDKSIVHDHMDFILVHRCLFENQPIFMGGPVDRLCI